MFAGSAARCDRCRRADLPEDIRKAKDISQANARRARKRLAQVAGPVPRGTYIEVIASGDCVYCGAEAQHVDHVRPLSAGGWEHGDNLVPACSSCNLSKGAKLLTDWDPVRVARAAAVSAKVAAELERLEVSV